MCERDWRIEFIVQSKITFCGISGRRGSRDKKTRFESDIAALTKFAELFADWTEENGDIMLIAKSNSLRRSAKVKGKQLAELDTEFKEKQMQLKSA